jgi:hypothetical protein
MLDSQFELYGVTAAGGGFSGGTFDSQFGGVLGVAPPPVITLDCGDNDVPYCDGKNTLGVEGLFSKSLRSFGIAGSSTT